AVDTATYSITGGSADNSLAGFDHSDSSAYSTRALNSSTGTYSFVTTATASNAMQATDTPSVSFTLNVTDSGNLSDSKVLTINLVGANDTLTLAASITSSNLTDTAANDRLANALFPFTTPFRSAVDTATYSITGGSADNSLAGFDHSDSSA